MKKVYGLIGALVIVCIVWFLYVQQKPYIPFVLSTQTIETDLYTMKIHAPLDSLQKIPEVATMISQATSSFQKQIDSLTPDDITELGLDDDRKYDLQIDTSIATSSGTVSYIIKIYEFTGGAHGNTTVQVFNYTNKGKYITEGDVFVSPWKQTVSQLAKAYLIADLGENINMDMLIDGTTPNNDHFNTWYITPDSIVFVFGQYEVGPYSIGIREVPLSKTVLSSVLKEPFK
jgi:hypothetical protein